MRASVELNGYVEVGGGPAFHPLDGAIFVRSLPTHVILRTVWRTEPGSDDPPGYLPFTRLALTHAEPNGAPEAAPMPDLYRTPLDRWDGASILFLEYTLPLRDAGEHRLAFPRTEVEEIVLQVRLIDGNESQVG